jgi:hypothetical protein
MLINEHENIKFNKSPLRDIPFSIQKVRHCAALWHVQLTFYHTQIILFHSHLLFFWCLEYDLIFMYKVLSVIIFLCKAIGSCHAKNHSTQLNNLPSFST